VTLAKDNPDVAEVHRALGAAYAKEKPTTAIAELETAIRLDPSDVVAHISLARLQRSQGNIKSAINQYQAAVKLEPNNAALQQELADASRALAKRSHN
jgi:Tfp pilus assembly protein PilF